MDGAELRALQQPLKDAYREDPGRRGTSGSRRC